MIAQGVKLVAEPLANLIGVPGVQDLAHNAQGLIVALKVSNVCCFQYLALTLTSHGFYRLQV